MYGTAKILKRAKHSIAYCILSNRQVKSSHRDLQIKDRMRDDIRRFVFPDMPEAGFSRNLQEKLY